MKKIVFILILVLLSSVVLAGETYKLDFSEENEYLVGVRAGDRVEFDLNGDRHTVIFREIKDKNADLTIFFNLNKENVPHYYTIGENKQGRNSQLRLDVERDDIDDLYIWLDSSLNGVAGIRFVKPIDNQITGDVAVDLNKKPSYSWIIFPLMIVILLVLIVFLKRRKEK